MFQVGAIEPESLVALLAVLVAPVVSYLIAARKLSGQIKNTDASELWAESRSIREWSSARIKELVDQIRRLEERVDEVESVNQALVAENQQLKMALEHERAVVARLKREAQHAFGPHVDLSKPYQPEEEDPGARDDAG